MALNHSPSIITNGLVFAYDMANTQKSWKGMPTTNQFTLPTGDINGFGVQNSTFTRVRTGNYGGYEIKPTDYVWRYNVTGNDCPYHGWDIPTTSGAVVTFSFDYYVDPSTTNYPVTNYLANFENAGSGVGGSVADPTPSIRGVWKRAYFSSTATATGNSRCLLYPGACGGRLGDAGFILYKNPQVEFNAPGSMPTPFVSGTRSNTQALVDLTDTNTITASSLTYASDGTFSFNGSNYVGVNSVASSGNAARSVFAWIKTSTGGCIFSSGTAAIGQAFNLVTYGSSKVGIMGYNTDFYPSTGANITNNAWHYVGAVANGSGTITTYVDGVQDNTGSVTYSTAGQNNFIGKSNHVGNENYWNGNISTVQYYNRALSAAEVKQNFNALRGRYGI